VTHLVVTPEWLAEAGIPLADVEARPYLRRVLFTGDRKGEWLSLFAVAPR